MNLTGMAARIVYSILAGLLAFIIVFILGLVITHFDASIGSFLERFAALIGLLVGLGYFFSGRTTPPTI